MLYIVTYYKPFICYAVMRLVPFIKYINLYWMGFGDNFLIKTIFNLCVYPGFVNGICAQTDVIQSTIYFHFLYGFFIVIFVPSVDFFLIIISPGFKIRTCKPICRTDPISDIKRREINNRMALGYLQVWLESLCDQIRLQKPDVDEEAVDINLT